MPNYQQGKIYKIVSPHTEKIYIGSTTKQYLSIRKAIHKAHYKTWKEDNTNQYCASFKLYDLGEVEFILLELYKCECKDELTAREMYWIEQHSDKVLNIKKPFLSKEGLKQHKHKYYEKNKEYFKEQRDIWKNNNKDKIKEYETIKFDCVCGSKDIRKHHRTRHELTDKHQTYLMIQTL
jgi:hypothetical protein